MALKAEAWSSSSVHPAARQRRHAVEVEIGDARGVAGNRLDRARQPLAEQDRDDDRHRHRPKSKHGRSHDALDLVTDLAGLEICAERPRLVAIAGDLAGNGDVSVLSVP